MKGAHTSAGRSSANRSLGKQIVCFDGVMYQMDVTKEGIIYPVQQMVELEQDTTINVIVERILNRIYGQITNLLDEGNVPYPIVTVGTKVDTGDVNGHYEVMVSDTGKLAFIINATDYHERREWVNVDGNVTKDENIVPTSFWMEPFDEMVRERNGGIIRWDSQPIFYHDIRGSVYYDAPGDSVGGTPPTEEQRAFIDSLVTVEMPVETYGFINNPNFIEGTDPPRLVQNPNIGSWEVPDGYFLIRRRDDMPGFATVRNYYNEDGSVRATLLQYSGDPLMRRGIVRQDGYQGLTDTRDITLLGPLETIFHNSSQLLNLSQYDKFLLKIAFKRMIGNMSPDSDPY